MDRTRLRAVQQPLKDTYRRDPAGAVVTLRARGRLGDEGISCSVETGRALAVAGLHPASGGEGALDFRGTLAVAKDVPVGFTAIRLSFELDTEASAEQVATLLRLTERYCVVYQTLAQSPSMTAEVTGQVP